MIPELESRAVHFLPPDFSPAHAAAVDAKLAAIRAEHWVRIPLAIESGSRAWGFPSPDSDYDCRFIFVRPIRQRISLWPMRDVIETPIEGDLDVNGWELAKALKLMLKGNAVILEWLASPLVYTKDSTFHFDMWWFANEWVDRSRIARHYLHLGRKHRALVSTDTPSPLKKLFYALRPAAALRWLGGNADEAYPPMNLPALLAECRAPQEVISLTADLIARKAETRELGLGLAPKALLDFIDAEFERAAQVEATEFRPISPEAIEAAEVLLMETLHRLWGGVD